MSLQECLSTQVPDEFYHLNLHLPRATYSEGQGVLDFICPRVDEDEDDDFFPFWLPLDQQPSESEWWPYGRPKRRGAMSAGCPQPQPQLPEGEGAGDDETAPKLLEGRPAASKSFSFKLVANAASTHAAAGAAQQAQQAPACALPLADGLRQLPASAALVNDVPCSPKSTGRLQQTGQQGVLGGPSPAPVPCSLHPKYAALVLRDLSAVAALSGTASPLFPCSTSFTSTSSSAASTPAPLGTRSPCAAQQAAGGAHLLHGPSPLAASAGAPQQQQQRRREEDERGQEGNSMGSAGAIARQPRRSEFCLPGVARARRASAGGPLPAGVQQEVSSTSGVDGWESESALQLGNQSAEPSATALGTPAPKPAKKSARRGLLKLFARLVGAKSIKSGC